MLLVFFTFLFFLTQGFFQEKLQRISAYTETLTVHAEKRNADLFKIFSFGHAPVGVDWLLIRFLASTSYIKATEGEHALAYYDLDLATEVDSAFFELYMGGTNILVVILNDKTGARELIGRGNDFRKNELWQYSSEFQKVFWPFPWQVPILQAYVLLFEFDDLLGASKAFQEAAKIPGGPPYLQNLAARLEKPGGQYEVGMRLLNFMIQTAPNEMAKEALEKKKRSLFIGQTLFGMNFAYKNFLDTFPEYHKKRPFSGEEIRKYWKKFMFENGYSIKDPWGGEFYLGENGQIHSSIPHEKVLGLE
ncbi:MAG: hypothetical protein HY843_07440 [Bdellovibrio sp.]|nr:hypothetical protein [Bdellovibrio sp.]